MQENKTKAVICLLMGGVLFAAYSDACAEEKEALVQPYRVPTFTGEPAEFKEIQPAIKPAKKIDSDLIFRTVVNCYPIKPWGIDVQLRAGLTYADQSKTTINTTDLGKYYVGVVAKMPIYSEPEIDRTRTREYQRRKETSDTIATMIKALATKRRAERLLGLYMSLERRSQLRVSAGIVDTTEQIGYLEKVAMTQAELDAANAEIEGARLALVGQCRPEVEDQVNNFLMSEIR